MRSGIWEYSRFIALAVVLTVGFAAPVLAQTATSDNYQVSQTQFGSGSTDQTCSDQYCARTSIGEFAAGDTSGPSTASFSAITNDSEPSIEVIVDPGESKMGVLTTEATASKSSTIRVQTYLSSGYVLQIVGDPPKYANHMLNVPGVPTASEPGKEMFGINLVDNSSPNIGANVAQVPSGQFSFGTVEANYNSPNLFMYESGAVVGRSNSASGRTDYTMSIVVNISNNTPAGRYLGDYAAVVIPVY